MTNSHQLAREIRQALQSPGRRVPAASHLADEAQDALTCIEAVMGAMSEIARAHDSERNYLGLQLPRASCDHGRALCYLLANNPLDLAGSALALHRSQIEQFLRAVFYAHIADDDQLQDFINEDKGPRRRTPKGKWENISVPEVSKLVEARLLEVEGAGSTEKGKLSLMVGNAWDPLCGMVHGGRAIHSLYLDGRNQIGCAVPAEIHFQVTVNCVGIVNFCLTVAATISDIPPQQVNDSLEAPLRAFHRYIDERNARLTALGWLNEVKTLSSLEPVLKKG